MNPAPALLATLLLTTTLPAQTHAPAEKPELLHRLLRGYQGWFNTPNDGSERNWTHYGFDKPGRAHIDLWPDVSELDPEERHDTPLKNADGTPA